ATPAQACRAVATLANGGGADAMALSTQHARLGEDRRETGATRHDRRRQPRSAGAGRSQEKECRMSPPFELTGPSAGPLHEGRPRHLVILLHGYGANGDDLIGLAPVLAPVLPDTL